MKRARVIAGVHSEMPRHDWPAEARAALISLHGFVHVPKVCAFAARCVGMRPEGQGRSVRAGALGAVAWAFVRVSFC